MRVSSLWMPPIGDFPAMMTAWRMRTLAQEGSVHPLVRQVATDIVRSVGPRDAIGQAGAIRDFLAAHVVFLRDPSGAELLHGAPWQLAQVDKYGEVRVDCDDAAILAAALGKAVGLLARYVLVGFLSPAAPFRHVWCELSSPIPPQAWVECDVTRSSQRLPSLESRRWILGV